jgi:glutamate synthase (NADPH) large chain
MHALLATGAVHHRLISEGLRCDANIVVETGTARDPHHFAVLIGYGATAIFPYLAYESLQGMVDSREIPEASADRWPRTTARASTRACSRSSPRWASPPSPPIGAPSCSRSWVSTTAWWNCASRTASAASRARASSIWRTTRSSLAAEAWNRRKLLRQGGLLKYVHGGEYHAYNPDVIQTLHKAVQTGDYDAYKEFARLVNERPVTVLRDLFGSATTRQSIARTTWSRSRRSCRASTPPA